MSDRQTAGPSAPKRAKWSEVITVGSSEEEFSSLSESELLVSDLDEEEDAQDDSTVVDEHQFETTTGWTKESQPPNQLKTLPFTKTRELLVPKPGDNPIDFFSLLFNEDFMNYVIEETNRNAVVVLSESESARSRIADWKDLTVDEFKVFLGLFYHMGVIQLSRIEDYWKTDRLFNLPIFRQQMSRNRFHIILRILHFSSDEEANADNDKDVLKKMAKVVDYFNNTMQSIYYPGKELVIEEGTMLWCGRDFTIKRRKYGVKLHLLTEPDGTIVRLLFTSKKNNAAVTGTTHHYATDIVLKLTEELLDQGHALYMDDYYNSCTLFQTLLERGTYCTGTLKLNLKDNPKEVSEIRLNKGENISRFKNGVHVGKWRNKRCEFMYITTQYDSDFDVHTTKWGGEILKPRAMLERDKYMSGNDHQEQLSSCHPCEGKAIRWCKKLFINVAQLYMLNSWKLYNSYSGNKRMPLQEFRLAIINSLLPMKMTIHRSPKHSKSKHSISLISGKSPDKPNSQRTKRKRCRLCTKEGRGRKQTIYECSRCSGKPGLCLQCFDQYHDSLLEIVK